MSIKKVYPRPTVKQVIFHIQYPNLFYIESRIAKIQLKVLEKFPESAMLVTTPLVFSQPGIKPIGESGDAEPQQLAQKIWQFISPRGYMLEIASDHLAITSNMHKTYQGDDPDKFREVIEYCLAAFSKQVELSYVNRVGLRYIDECPFPTKDTGTFNDSFHSAINTGRFPLEATEEYYFRSVKNVGEHKILYQEVMTSQKPGVIILDFDGFAARTEYPEILATTDELHKIVAAEFEASVKEPIIKYMEGEQ